MSSDNHASTIIQKFSSCAPVLVIGDIGLDKYTQGEVSRISPEAPVPILEVVKEWPKLGLAANVADNLKGLGVDCTLVGLMGDDPSATLMEKLLQDTQLKTSGLIKSPSRQTTQKQRITTKTQQLCRVDFESKSPLTADELGELKSRVEQFCKTSSGIIVQDYAKGLINQQVMSLVFEAGHKYNKKVYIDPSRETPAEFYRGAYLLKPNLQEAFILSQQLASNKGQKPPKTVGEVAHFLLRELKLQHLVITLGAEGMCLLSQDSSDIAIIPTMAQEVFDVSGAGDTVISVLCAAMESGCTLSEAAFFSNAAAGVVVAKVGTAKVSPEELLQFIQKTTLLP